MPFISAAFLDVGGFWISRLAVVDEPIGRDRFVVLPSRGDVVLRIGQGGRDLG